MFGKNKIKIADLKKGDRMLYYYKEPFGTPDSDIFEGKVIEISPSGEYLSMEDYGNWLGNREIRIVEILERKGGTKR